MGRDHPVLGRDVAATASLDELAERVARLERVVEQIAGAPVPQILEVGVNGLQHVPQERVQNSAVEKIGGVPVPQIWEPIVDGPHLIPQERVQNRTPDQIVVVPVPQISENSLPSPSQERVQNRTLEQIVDFPVPRTMEAIVEVVPSPPQERVPNRTHEQIVDFPVPRTMEAGVQVSFSMPQVRVQNCTQEQNMDFPEPRILEVVPPERTQEFIAEQISVVPQTTENFVSAVQPVPPERIRERLVEQISVVPQTTGKYGHVLRPVPSERIQERLVDVGFIKGLDRYNMPRPGDVMVPVPQIMEAAAEFLHASQECVQIRTSEQIVDVAVPRTMEAIVEVVPSPPQERVQNRTPVVVPVPQITEDSLPFVPQEGVQNRTPEQIVCPNSRKTACSSHHRSACNIVLWSRSSMSQCLRSWRPPWKLCVLHHRSAW